MVAVEEAGAVAHVSYSERVLIPNNSAIVYKHGEEAVLRGRMDEEDVAILARFTIDEGHARALSSPLSW